MALFDRISRTIRATITSWVSDVEDPEKVLEQAMADMQDQLIQLRQAVAQAIATQKRTERQHQQATATAQEWYGRAQMALQKNEEAMAREALTRRQTLLGTAQALKNQLDQQADIVTQLKNNMRLLEGKLSEARTKKDMYIARARSAKASQQLQEMLGQVGNQGAIAAFDRMENRIYELEARAEAMAELSQGDPLEKRFAALEAGEASTVEAELEAMKANMLPGRNSPSLPPLE